MNVDGRYIVKGDATCDQRITIEDLIAIQAHLLGILDLTGDSLIASDVINEGEVTTIDAYRISRHINGINVITEVIEK